MNDQYDPVLACVISATAAFVSATLISFWRMRKRPPATVINITMPTVTRPTAEDGQRIREALEAAKKTYGGETP